MLSVALCGEQQLTIDQDRVCAASFVESRERACDHRVGWSV